MSTELLSLHDGWTVRPVAGPVPDEVAEAGPVPATVPGSVHTDLLAAGLHPRPLPRRQRAAARLDRAAPTGATRRPSSGHPVAAIASSSSSTGLDTVATVDLNGDVVARTANMHRTYRFDVRDLLREGTNRLSVDLRLAGALRRPDQPRARARDRTSTTTRSTPSARWPATSAGTGARTLVDRRHLAAGDPAAWRAARLAAVRPVVDVDGARGLRRRARRRGAGRRVGRP